MIVDRRDFLRTATASGASLLLLRELAAAPFWLATEEDPWVQVPQILSRIKRPAFRKRDFTVTRFGAIGNGRVDCTDAFRQAIAACNRAGGGRVLVPDGEGSRRKNS